MEVTAQIQAETLIAADVGGTHVRLALARATSDQQRPIELEAGRKYRCADYPGLGDILAAYMSELGLGLIQCGVIASAGYVLDDGSVLAANLPWKLVPAQICQQLGMQALHVVNDFEAVAYAAHYMVDNEVLHLSGPRQIQSGPALVLGPGTGLGAAVWIPQGDSAVVLATEGGHATLAAGSELEFELLKELRRTRSHVATEHLLSGPGLLTLYRTLCVLRSAEPIHNAPSEVTAAALAGDDVLAYEALSAFCGLLGSAAGDMALLCGIRGGIYLAGGFLPQIADFLAESEFVSRLLNKGAMRQALTQIPVKVVEHGQLGVIGAAIWWSQRGRQ